MVGRGLGTKREISFLSKDEACIGNKDVLSIQYRVPLYSTYVGTNIPPSNDVLWGSMRRLLYLWMD